METCNWCHTPLIQDDGTLHQPPDQWVCPNPGCINFGNGNPFVTPPPVEEA